MSARTRNPFARVVIVRVVIGLSVIACAVSASAQSVGSGGADVTSSTKVPTTGSDNEFFGSFTTSVPIEVPAYHGITPNLSLSYNSSAGNGLVGVGWQLAGIPIIERHSVGKGAPRLIASDIYLYDGQELAPCVSGSASPSCGAGGNYSSKIEDYRRYNFDGSKWRVTTQDGTVQTFISIDNTDGGITTRWGIQSVVDTNGNTVTYNWASAASGVDAVPTNVSYDGMSVTFNLEARSDVIASANGGAIVTLANRLHSISVAVGGATLRSYQLSYSSSSANGRSVLQSVQELGQNGSTALPAITFGWQAGDDGSFNLGAQGKGFSITDVANPYYPSHSPWPSCNFAQTADVNGDGKADFIDLCTGTGLSIYNGVNNVAMNGQSVAVRLSNGDGTFGAPHYTPTQANRFFFRAEDVDGDGKADMVFENGDLAGQWSSVFNPSGTPATPESIPTLCVYLSQGNGTFGAEVKSTIAAGVTPFTSSTPTLGRPFAMADVNGDGRADLITSYTDPLSGSVSPNLGFFDVYLASSDGTVSYKARTVRAADTTVTAHNSMLRTFADVNGDGRADALQTSDYGCTHVSQGICYLDVRLANGDGTFAAEISRALLLKTPVTVVTNLGGGITQSYTNISLPFAGTGDVNGDGLDDILVGNQCDAGLGIFLSHGNGTFDVEQHITTPYIASLDYVGGPAPTNTTCGGATLVDLNGDGRAELVAQVFDHTVVYTHQPNGTFSSAALYSLPRLDAKTCDVPPGVLGSGTCYQDSYAGFGDFNGDGKVDVLRSNPPGRVGGSGANVFLRNGAMADALTSVQNGYGGTTTVSYTSSTSFTNQNNPPITRAVTSIATSDGRGGNAATNYSYSGGLYDRLDRRFLGFSYAKKTLPALSNEPAPPFEESWFHQDYGSYSKPEHTIYRDGSGRALHASYYVYGGNGGTIPYTSLLTETQDWTCANGIDCVATPTAARKHSVQRSYNAYGNVTIESDNGLLDLSGDEHQTVTTYAPPNTNAYLVGKVAVQQLFDGATKLSETQLWYDGASTYNAAPTLGRVTRSLKWRDLPTALYATQSYAYDAYGNRIELTDELGNTSHTTYDSSYHLYPIAVTNALSQSVSTSWDYVCGAPKLVTDANSIATSFSYDALCRLTSKSSALGGFENRFYCSSSGTCGGVSLPACGVASAQYSCIETPTADGLSNQWSKNFFDGLGHEYHTEQKGTRAILSDASYDARGNVATKSLPYYAGDSAYSVNSAYDPQNRVILTTEADGSTVSKSYLVNATGNPALTTVHTVDEAGHTFEQDADVFGLQRASREAPNGSWIERRSSYDKRGLLVRTTDPVAPATGWGSESVAESYGYDSLGRRISESSPDHGTRTSVYDDGGHLLAQTDALSQQTRLFYDALGRTTQKVLRNGSADAVSYSYLYDEARAGCFDVGHLTTTIDPSGQHRQCFDQAGRVVNEVRVVDGVAYPQSFVYDGAGRLTAQRYPDADTLGPIQYDAAGRVVAIGGVVSQALYDAAGRLVKQTNANPNGAVTTRTYLPTRGWLTSLNTISPAGQVQNLSFPNYQADGLLRNLTGMNTAETWSYAYDGAHRLLSANAQTFAYADNGNLLTSPLGNYSYGGAHPHAVTQAGSNGYVYDANGNMISRSGGTITYDGADRPTSLDAVAITYDDGARLKKATAGMTTIYPAAGVEVQVTSGCNSTLTKYISLAGNLVAKRVGTVTAWIHVDHLGSVQAVTDSGGNVIERRAYQPYGDDQGADVSGKFSESHDFAGKHRDETGLIEMGARYYDPQLGRFISADPTTSDGINRYMYALNNPVGKVDPSGFGADDAQPFPLLVSQTQYQAPRLDDDYSGVNHPPHALQTDRLPPILVPGPNGVGGTTTQQGMRWLESWREHPYDDFGLNLPLTWKQFHWSQYATNVDQTKLDNLGVIASNMLHYVMPTPEAMVDRIMRTDRSILTNDCFVCRHHAAMTQFFANQIPGVSATFTTCEWFNYYGRLDDTGHAFSQVTISNRVFEVDSYNHISYELKTAGFGPHYAVP